MPFDSHGPHPEELCAQALQRHQEAVAGVFAARDRQPVRLGGKRMHHVIVQSHATDRQIAATLRRQIHPSPPRRVLVAQDDAGAAAAGHALYTGQDGVEHRFQAIRLQQQPVHLTQCLQIGVLSSDALRAAVEMANQGLQFVAPLLRHGRESAGRKFLESILQCQQARAIATHQVYRRHTGAQQRGSRANGKAPPQIADGGAAGKRGYHHQHGEQGTQDKNRREPPDHSLLIAGRIILLGTSA